MVNPKGERKKLGDLLIEIGMVDRFQLQRAAQAQKQNGTRLLRAIVELGFVDEDRLCRAVSTALGCETVNLGSMKIHDRVVSMLPARLAVRHGALPIAIKRANQTDYLYLVMADPLDADAVEELERMTGCKTNVLIAPPTQLDAAIEKYYRPSGATSSSADTSTPQLAGSGAPTQRPADTAQRGAPPGPPPSSGGRSGRATASMGVPPPPSGTGTGPVPPAPAAARSATAPVASSVPSRAASVQAASNVAPARAAQTVISPPPAQASPPPPSQRPGAQTTSAKSPKPRSPSPPPARAPQPSPARSTQGAVPVPRQAPPPAQVNGGSARSTQGGRVSSALGDALPPLTGARPGSDVVRTQIDPLELDLDSPPSTNLRIFDAPSEPELPSGNLLPDPSEVPEKFSLPQITRQHEWEDGQTLDVGMDEISPDVAALLSEAGIQPARGAPPPRLDDKDLLPINDGAIVEPQTAEVDLQAAGMDSLRRSAASTGRAELDAPWLPEVEPDAVLGKASPRTQGSSSPRGSQSSSPGGLFAPRLPEPDLLGSGDLGEPPLVSEATHSETELDASLLPPMPPRRPSAPPGGPMSFVHALELPVDIGSAPSPFDVLRNVDLRAGLDRTGIIPAIDWEKEEFVPPPVSAPSPAPDSSDPHLVGFDDIPSSPAAVRARAVQSKKEEEPARKGRATAPARRMPPTEPAAPPPAPAAKEPAPAPAEPERDLADRQVTPAESRARTVPAPGPSPSAPPPPLAKETPSAAVRARRRAAGQHEDEPTNPRIARAPVREALVESAEPTPTPASPDAVDRAQVMAELDGAPPPRSDTAISQPREQLLEPEIIPLRAEDAEELEPLVPEPQASPRVESPLVRALLAGESLTSADRAQLVLAIGRVLIKKGLISEDELAAALSTD